MMKNMRTAVFASGTGSNFQSIMDDGERAVDVVLLVCDRSDAPVLSKAEYYKVETFVFHPKAFASKELYEHLVLEKLCEMNVAWIVLAGYMRMVGPTLLQSYDRKIVNIHPSLLPQFPGKDAIGQAYRAGVQTTGVTVHYVDEGMDTGDVIAQQEVPVLPGDTKDSLAERIQQAEHQLYPAAIQQLLEQSE